jgi:hypothetical protein
MRLASWPIAVFLVFLVAAIVAGAFFAPTAFTPTMTVGYILTGVTLLAAAVAIVSVTSALSNSQWSIAEALSEEVAVEIDDPANPGKKLTVSKSKSSTSRLIALMGMMVILVLYVCIGAACVWSLTQQGKFPDSALQGAAFLTSGLSLFVPYIVSKTTK